MKKIGVIIIACAMLIALTGFAMADRVVPAVPSSPGIVTTTVKNVEGTFTETVSAAMTLTDNPYKSHQLSAAAGVLGNDGWLSVGEVNQLLAAGGSFKGTPTFDGPDGALDGYHITELIVPDSLMNVQDVYYTKTPKTWAEVYAGLVAANPTAIVSDIDSGIHTGILNTGQVQYTTSYDSSIVAQAGTTNLVKSLNINLGNTVIGQSNIDAKTALTFAATDDGGNVVGSENLMLDGAATGKTASDVMLCPFSSAGANLIPAYCNIIQAGSAYDLTVGSVTTAANERFVGTDATMPVILNYNINVKPYGTSAGQIPAMGSASAYVKSHIQEARGTTNNVRSEDLVYSETSSVNGMISGFTKDNKYQSGMSLL